MSECKDTKVVTVEQKGAGFWICGSKTELDIFQQNWPAKYPLSTREKGQCLVAGSKREANILSTLVKAGLNFNWRKASEEKLDVGEERQVSSRRKKKTKNRVEREEDKESTPSDVAALVKPFTKPILVRFAWELLGGTRKFHQEKPASQLRAEIIAEMHKSSKSEMILPMMQEEYLTRTRIKEKAHEERKNTEYLVRETKKRYPVGSVVLFHVQKIRDGGRDPEGPTEPSYKDTKIPVMGTIQHYESRNEPETDQKIHTLKVNFAASVSESAIKGKDFTLIAYPDLWATKDDRRARVTLSS